MIFVAKSNSFTCPKCGSTSFDLKQAGRYTEIVCRDCGTFIRYLRNGNDIKRAFEMLRKEGRDMRAQKIIKKIGDVVTVRCDVCNTILYSSALPPVPRGQYDVLKANYCPNCGKEFVDEQKIFTKPT